MMKLITRTSALIWMITLAIVALDIVRSSPGRPALTAEQAAALRMAAVDVSREMVAMQPPSPARDVLRDVLSAIAESAPAANASELAAFTRRGRSALGSLTRTDSVDRRDAAAIAALLDRIDTLIAVPPTPNSRRRSRS
jgi:hypothetical protein